VDTGALREGMSVKPVSGMAAVHVGIHSEQEYWKYVEFGTSRMNAHPFIGPAVQESLPELKEIMKSHVILATLNSTGPTLGSVV
jgi:HK97 gp10 family phage protein